MHRTPVYRTIVLSTCVFLVATGFTLDAHRYIIRPRVGPRWNQSPVWHTEARAQRFHLQCRQYRRLWRQRLLYCLSHLHMQPAQSSRRCVTSSSLTLKDSSFFFFFRPGRTSNVSRSLPPHSPFTTLDNGITSRTRINGPGCSHCYTRRRRCRPLLGVAGQRYRRNSSR